MESVDNRFEFRFRRAAAITSVLVCVAAAVRLVGRELGRSKSMGDGSGRVRIDGMGDMSNGGDGNGRRGMDGSGLARTTGSGCCQGFGWVWFLVFFRLRDWRDCPGDVVIIEAGPRVDSGRNEGLKIALVQAF